MGQVNALGTGRANQAEAYANGGLFAASKEMADLLDEATRAWALQFDASYLGCTVPAADLVEWFTTWRQKGFHDALRTGRRIGPSDYGDAVRDIDALVLELHRVCATRVGKVAA